MDVRAVAAMLDRHQAADSRESAFVQQTRAMLLGTARPLARSQLDPGHLTASAFVLSPDGLQVLLIHHAKLGLWLQPGGHIDADDRDVFAAARRELAEEAGVVDVQVEPGFPDVLDVDVHDIPASPRKGEAAHRHFDVRALLRARSWALTAGSDALAARWVPLDQVEDAGTDDSVRRAIRKLLERR
jgi:8-oxo-dGTP pyrophosphatase MutT (NUDIX family)